MTTISHATPSISSDSFADDIVLELARLPYSLARRVFAVLNWVILPVLVAAACIQGAEYFFAQTSGQVTETTHTVLISVGGACLLLLLFGLWKVNKLFGAKYIFNDNGILENGQLTAWDSIDHAEVYAEPRPGDKASIVLYVDGGRELGLKIKRHELRMKVSEAIRCHITNIAFKD